MRTPRVVTFVLLIAFAATVAPAQPPPDPFEIISGSNPGGTTIQPGTGTLPPVPADFFGPGSDPFDGRIYLQGRPVDEPQFGTGACLLQRSSDPMSPGAPVGTFATVPTEILALDLVSTEPIIVTYGGLHPEEWDVRVVPSVIPPPLGATVVTKEHINGGTFESIFYVLPRLEFTRVSDGMLVIWDTGLESVAPLELYAPGPWVHALSPSLEIIAPSDGIYVPGVYEAVPGNPTSQCLEIMTAVDAAGAVRLTLRDSRYLPSEDPFVVMPGPGPDGTYVEFGAGNSPPLPADFFGPGSDPFEGQVCLQGEPVGPTWGILEDANTLVLRSSDPFDRCELSSPEARTFGLELIALELRSIDPITVTYWGGASSEFWDVFSSAVPGSSPALESETDKITVTKTHINGGAYEATFSVQPIYTFVRVLDGETRVLDTALEGLPPLVFSGIDGHWVHTVDPTLHLVAPSDGEFVPGVQEVIPGNPSSQQLRLLHAVEISGAGLHTLAPLERDLTGLPLPLEGAQPGLTVFAHPNPFRPLTTIRYSLPWPGRLTLEVFNVRGELVRCLRDEVVGAGSGAAVWNGRDSTGRLVTGGVYFYRLSANDDVRTGKIVMIR